MKKIILSSIFAVALIATVSFGINKSMKSNANLSDLALANVEALANGEFPDLINMCIHDCTICACYIPAIDIDPEGLWVYNARSYY